MQLERAVCVVAMGSMVATLALAAPACTSFQGDPSSPGSDASPADGSSAASETGILTGGDFEAVTTGQYACGQDWVSERATLAAAAPPFFQGSGACRICSADNVPSQADVYLSSPVLTVPTAPNGKAYVANGELRVASGAISVAELIFVEGTEDWTTTPLRDVVFRPGNDWRPFGGPISKTITDGTARLQVIVHFQLADETRACLDVDALSVTLSD